jgi:glutaredoxin
MTQKAILYRMVIDGRICPYGPLAKNLLESNGYEIEEHLLTTREETDAFKKQHDVATTPQVFIDGKRIGGYDDLRNFLIEGRK